MARLWLGYFSSGSSIDLIGQPETPSLVCWGRMAPHRHVSPWEANTKPFRRAKMDDLTTLVDNVDKVNHCNVPVLTIRPHIHQCEGASDQWIKHPHPYLCHMRLSLWFPLLYLWLWGTVCIAMAVTDSGLWMYPLYAVREAKEAGKDVQYIHRKADLLLSPQCQKEIWWTNLLLYNPIIESITGK